MYFNYIGIVNIRNENFQYLSFIFQRPKNIFYDDIFGFHATITFLHHLDDKNSNFFCK
jgi:hypothetical protein